MDPLYQTTIVMEIWRAMYPLHSHPECHPGDVEPNGPIARQDSAQPACGVDRMACPVRPGMVLNPRRGGLHLVGLVVGRSIRSSLLSSTVWRPLIHLLLIPGPECLNPELLDPDNPRNRHKVALAVVCMGTKNSKVPRATTSQIISTLTQPQLCRWLLV